MNVLANPLTSTLPQYDGSSRSARASISKPGRVRVRTHDAPVPSTSRVNGAFHAIVYVLFADRSLVYF